MAKPNYAFAKRQRDLAKKQKKEEKKLRKAQGTPADGDAAVDEQDADGTDQGGEQVAGAAGEPNGQAGDESRGQEPDGAQDRVTGQA
jgi:hypothetical protein